MICYASAMSTEVRSAQNRYAQDGVDVHAEAGFSKMAGAVCKGSYQNSPFVQVHDLAQGHFRGPRPFTLKNLPEGYVVEASADGVGTKSVLIDAAGAHETAGYDLVAMVSSDITRYGGVPLVLTNILDVVAVGEITDLHNAAYTNLMRGLGNAARDVRGVILKGETAQMGVCVGSEDAHSSTRFNWSASMFGAYHPTKMVTGNDIAEGDMIVALQENGFRSNGISSVRAAFKKQFGEQWYKNADALPYIKEAAAPSVLYDVYVNTLHGWYAPDFTPEVTLHAIVHLSGGGVKEKLGNDVLFGRELSATLPDLFELPSIMKTCAQWRGFSDEELYGSWNGGQGMLLIVPPQDAARAVARAADFGIVAKIAGTITKQKTPRLVVHSKLNDTEIVFE